MGKCRSDPIRPDQPVCPQCGGRLILSVVNFGDLIPSKELHASEHHSAQADVFLVVGSSLKVTPASNMPIIANKNGAKLIIINHMKTEFDEICDLRFFENAGEVLSKFVEKIKRIKNLVK